MKNYFVAADSPRLQQAAAPERLLRQDVAASLGILPEDTSLSYGCYAASINGYLTALTAEAAAKMIDIGYTVVKFRELPYSV